MKKKLQRNKFEFGSIQYNGEDCYCLYNTRNHLTCIFDKDDTVKQALMELQQHHNIYTAQSEHCRVFRYHPTPGQKALNDLAAFIYEVETGRKASGIIRRKVIDRNDCRSYYDCRLCNLYDSGVSTEKTKNREVQLIDGKMILTHKGITINFTYNEVLYEILTTPSICTITLSAGDRLKARFYQTGDIVMDMYCHDLAYYCYAGYITTAHGVYERVRELKEWMDQHDMSVDHLNTDQRNCCEYNLSLMSQRLNKSKAGLFSKIRYPYALAGVATPDGAYLLYLEHLGLKHEIRHIPMVQRFRAGNAELLVDLLRKITTLNWETDEEDTFESIKRTFEANKADEAVSSWGEWSDSRAGLIRKQWQMHPEWFVDWQANLELCPRDEWWPMDWITTAADSETEAAK